MSKYHENQLREQLLSDPRLHNKPAYIAYILATVKHETGDTFQPVKEAYWLSEEWRRKNLRYFPYYGRGFVQITWEENYNKVNLNLTEEELANSPAVLGDKSYENISKLLGEDLTANPDLALRWPVAYEILVQGMLEGWFTGKKLSDYDKHSFDFYNARHIVNGLDKASVIAAYAKEYLETLPLPSPALAPEYLSDTQLQLGDKGPFVSIFQALLNYWYWRHDGIPAKLKVDGDFGNETEKALLLFQRRNKMDDTLVVEDDEWEILLQQL